MKTVELKGIKRFILFICAISFGTMFSWGQTWNLSPTMTATLDKNGVMIIATSKSSEAMPDYTSTDNVPWRTVRNDILSLVIENKVTTIGNVTFGFCTSLKKVTIANSVERIGLSAFVFCPITDMVVAWSTPISITTNIFDNGFTPVNYSGMKLHVPAGTKSRYQNANVWKNFGTIVEYSPTGNDRIEEQKLKASPSNGSLNISGLLPGKPFFIYSITGQLIYRGIAKTDEEKIALHERGVYIILSGNQTIKTVVH